MAARTSDHQWSKTKQIRPNDVIKQQKPYSMDQAADQQNALHGVNMPKLQHTQSHCLCMQKEDGKLV